ncbi:MAG TPA: hypothetical protein VGN17_13175 [Bryobacteraceae bacterium]
MNAVAANTNIGPGILAAFPLPAAPAQVTPMPSGFVNLMNALLAPLEAAPQEDPTTASSSRSSGLDNTQDSLPVRTSSEIADAMIRSMLGSPVTAANLFSDQSSPAPQTGSTKARDPKDDPQPAADQTGPAPVQMLAIPVVPSAVPLPAAPLPVPATLISSPSPDASAPDSPALARNNTPGGQNSGSSKFRAGSASLVSSELKPTVAKADLAFSLKLTPLQTREAPAPVVAAAPALPKVPAPLPVAAPVADPAPAAPAAAEAPLVSGAVSPYTDAAPVPQPPQPKEDPSNDAPRTNLPRPAIADAKPQQKSNQDSDSTPVEATAATSNDHGGDFSRPLPNPQPAPVAEHLVDAPQAEPFRTAEQALRAVDGTAPTTAAPRTSPAQQIAVRVTSPDAPAVDLHVTERAGHVLVSVRTPDTGLQSSLRQDLGTLVNSLDRAGYKAEAITPRDAASFTGNTLTAVAEQSSGASFMDARNHAQSGNQNGGENPGQNSRGGSQQQGSSQDQRNHSGGQQHPHGRRHLNWIDTIDTLENAQ